MLNQRKLVLSLRLYKGTAITTSAHQIEAFIAAEQGM